MKLPQLSVLSSFCALLTLLGSGAANSEEAPHARHLSPVPWHPSKEPSRLLKWTTDPQHAWWDKALFKRDDTPSQASPVTLPTKCQYVAANTQSACGTGCICGTSCTSIYIWNQSRPEPRPQYHICTNWNLNHGYQLRAGFQEAGFAIVPNRTQCGWQKFEGVTALRVGRGSIDVNGTEEQPFGDPYELARIEQVMREEYPFVEIIIICATLVGPIFMFAGIGGWCIWAQKDRTVKYRRLPTA
ncbi:uncharacterized protein PV09_09616 [Verruconis gallopava]|uniref:Uncharacterized protein n=1 Tax=Verruconis gallopava TaxID=253628 RepID=A0A0D1ZX38_9PEZI|nr:uncharacterized protein PV09_09616 [Verruconis gallopava]KIV98599.1 hypothetical protein PV09_09616 [Verruconis gallopava]